jgi:predicted DNA-binding transcriptional regulator YafY
VDVVVRTPAADVEKVVSGWGTVEAIDDGSCRLRMTVDGLEWPAMVLAAVGADFDVVEPAELRADVGRIAALFGRAAG